MTTGRINQVATAERPTAIRMNLCLPNTLVYPVLDRETVATIPGVRRKGTRRTTPGTDDP